MKIVTQFDPSAAIFGGGSTTTPPSGTINCQIPPGPGKIMIFNQSLINLILTFNNAAYTDYIPAGVYRNFELSLPNWNITWVGVSAEPNTALNSGLSAAVSLVTVVSYEESEVVPTIEPATSFINPWNFQQYAGIDIQSTHWNGTASSLFTLTSSASAPSTTTCYISGVWLTTVPTAASGDTGTMEVQITGLGGFGGTFKAYIFANNNADSHRIYAFNLNPPMNGTAPGAAITVTGTKVATTGSGFSNTCAVTAQFYHV